ncbi:glutathione S-transferase T3-like [Oryza glaberrima]|uniref:glutathione S-transferase T3-like n=1 Tax=Oryza glaberrima TaxID=4538 RepID=UPI00224C25FD|nr:glutathione S-transferase T3-like [Oryza glaberrima]
MDPDRAYYSFLEDSEVAHPFGQSRSQVDLHHRQDDFPYAHAEFPAFSTQQPTDGASNGGLRSASRAGTRHRVQANPVGEDDGRGRMYYTRDEDLRLVSAWLFHSTDPIEGNSRKGDTYWRQVTATYNSTTEDDRKRDPKHLKGHWHKTTRKISAFNGIYIQLRDNYESGRSEEMLMEQALEMYRSRVGQPFTLVYWWKAVCDSPKWNAHISLLGRGPRKIAAEFDVNAAPIEEHEEQPRPMGIKRAKKAKQAGISLEVKDLVKSLVDAKARQDEETSAMKEFQQKLSEEKTQTANILLLAAQEKTKAKLIEQQTKLLEKFTEMIAVDTSCMEPWAREAHIRACTHMSDQLWGKGPSMQ